MIAAMIASDFFMSFPLLCASGVAIPIAVATGIAIDNLTANRILHGFTGGIRTSSGKG
jgi:hypothetical protein